jgi:hypothetical protein
MARLPVFNRGSRSKEVVFLGKLDVDVAESALAEPSPGEGLNGSKIDRAKLWLFLKGLGALANNFRFEALCDGSSMSFAVGAVVIIVGAAGRPPSADVHERGSGNQYLRAASMGELCSSFLNLVPS